MNWRYWVAGLVLVGLVGIMASMATAEEAKAGEPAAAAVDPYRSIGLALGAALAAGISIAGAGYAVAKVGSAAMGAITEKPELMVRAIIFVALGEGLAVLGLVIAVMLVLKL
jgi:V/A-type H+-transporting ATPase subunit K